MTKEAHSPLKCRTAGHLGFPNDQINYVAPSVPVDPLTIFETLNTLPLGYPTVTFTSMLTLES
jgi:hypothetical protein